MLRRSFCSFAQHGPLVATFGGFRIHKTQQDNGVLHLVIDGPNKLNLLDDKFSKNLRCSMETINEMDAAARAVVISAEPDKHFCAGLNLKKAGSLLFEDATATSKAKAAASAALGLSNCQITEQGQPAMRAQRVHRTIKTFQDAMSSVARCRVPVIAAIDGQCIGGGFNLATACDIRYCTAKANFSLREARVGVCADIGALQRLPLIVGQGVARELAFTARDIDADEAQKLGVVNKVFDSYDDCLKHAFSVAGIIASNSPLAVQGTKEIMNHDIEPKVQASLDYVRMWNSAFLKSDDLVEATIAFAQKRTPKFTDHVVSSNTHPNLETSAKSPPSTGAKE